MDRMIVENVRCFRGGQTVPLAPLTILVGENSSGKSTFLALSRLVWDLASGSNEIDFNEEPFLLGAYDQIASRRILGHNPKDFTIGAEIHFPPWVGSPAITVSGTFQAWEGQPVLQKILLETSPYRCQIERSPERETMILEAEAPSGWLKFEQPTARGAKLDLFLLWTLVEREVARGGKSIQGEMSKEDLHRIEFRFFRLPEHLGPRPFAFAPIRMRPQRTYDPVKGIESPEGSHIPMILARTYSGDPESWQDLRMALDEFGRQSGLFKNVQVRRLGEEESDPFQIQVDFGGPAFNLLDVGYGVSQILPIIVDCLRGEQGGTFLLQQPEVHLHPKAQAELGSFLAVLAQRQDKRFFIETHSDYLVDRVRMDVRDRKHGLQPKDVSLLYFERRNGDVLIHHLNLDEYGNIENPPSGYRSFFLEEERRFLGG